MIDAGDVRGVAGNIDLPGWVCDDGFGASLPARNVLECAHRPPGRVSARILPDDPLLTAGRLYVSGNEQISV